MCLFTVEILVPATDHFPLLAQKRTLIPNTVATIPVLEGKADLLLAFLSSAFPLAVAVVFLD